MIKYYLRLPEKRRLFTSDYTVNQPSDRQIFFFCRNELNGQLKIKFSKLTSFLIDFLNHFSADLLFSQELENFNST